MLLNTASFFVRPFGPAGSIACGKFIRKYPVNYFLLSRFSFKLELSYAKNFSYRHPPAPLLAPPSPGLVLSCIPLVAVPPQEFPWHNSDEVPAQFKSVCFSNASFVIVKFSPPPWEKETFANNTPPGRRRRGGNKMVFRKSRRDGPNRPCLRDSLFKDDGSIPSERPLREGETLHALKRPRDGSFFDFFFLFSSFFFFSSLFSFWFPLCFSRFRSTAFGSRSKNGNSTGKRRRLGDQNRAVGLL